MPRPCVGRRGLELLASCPALFKQILITQSIERRRSASASALVTPAAASPTTDFCSIKFWWIAVIAAFLRTLHVRLGEPDGCALVAIVDCKQRIACPDGVVGDHVDLADNATIVDSDRDYLARRLDQATRSDRLPVRNSQGARSGAPFVRAAPSFSRPRRWRMPSRGRQRSAYRKSSARNVFSC